MKRLGIFVTGVLLLVSKSWATKVTAFVDLPTFAERAQDVVLVTCERGTVDTEWDDDGFRHAGVTVVSTLKGKTQPGPMTIATLYPMRAGKTYMVMSLGGSGGSVPGVTIFATAQLSVVELPVGFDRSALAAKPLEAQLRAVFAARLAEVERQQKQLKEESDLLLSATKQAA